MTRSKRSNGSKGRSKVTRFKPYKPWSQLIPFDVPPNAKASNVIACFQNHLVTVFVKQAETPLPNPEGRPSKMTHLMMVWTDPSRKEEIPYRFKQKVKRELCSEMSEGVELFPADWREQDMVQTHLWVLEPGAIFPLGIVPVDPESAIAETVGGRENLVTRDELDVFVVRYPDPDPESDTGEILEVFESEDECKKIYRDQNAEIPDGASSSIMMIGNIPVEGEGVAWSAKAKAKVGGILAKSRDLSRQQPKSPQLFYEHLTIEDEIWESEDFPEMDPSGDEETVAIGMAMDEALKNKGDKRAAEVRKVAEEVIGKVGQNIVSARGASPRIIVPR